MIHLLQEHVSPDQLHDMLIHYEDMIKIVVDIRRRWVAGRGEMHSDCENILLENGSELDDLWGANWYPHEQHIAFESLINIRPRAGNRGIIIQDETLRNRVQEVTMEILGGVR